MVLYLFGSFLHASLNVSSQLITWRSEEEWSCRTSQEGNFSRNDWKAPFSLVSYQFVFIQQFYTLLCFLWMCDPCIDFRSVLNISFSYMFFYKVKINERKDISVRLCEVCQSTFRKRSKKKSGRIFLINAKTELCLWLASNSDSCCN